MVNEEKLKKQIFYFLLFAKVLTIIIIFIEWRLGVFIKQQMLGTITFILPLFTVYTTLMLKQFMQNRNESTANQLLSRTIRTITFIVLSIYTVLIIFVIHGVAKHYYEYDEMLTYLGLVETGFGVYVGQIVFSLFNKKNEIS